MVCNLCPRKCNAERKAETGSGYCHAGTEPRIARAALHYWEEPCISGTRGSGTVFFSHCTLGCKYCQNYSISHEGFGKTVTVQRMADIFRELCDQGAHNINLVTGTQYWPQIRKALDLYRPPIPIVWNTGGYERKDTIQSMRGYIDIFLPDLKHVSPRLSALCAEAPDYFECASEALKQMCEQAGAPEYDRDGMMLSGVLVRHLILPGCTADSMRVLDFIAEELPQGTPVSLMRQYTPIPECTVSGLQRRITDREYQRVYDHFQLLGLNGFTQEKSSAEKEYTPPFDLTGI